MAVLALALFFVLLGLGVLFVALRGGRGSRGPELDSKDRTKRRLALGGFVLALVGLGIGVPAAVIGAVKGRDAVPEAGVSSLTSAEKNGRVLFGQQCKVCHSLDAAAATALVGPDLDTLRPTKELVLDAIKNGRARGNGQMGANLVVGEEAEEVAAFVAKAVGK